MGGALSNAEVLPTWVTRGPLRVRSGLFVQRRDQSLWLSSPRLGFSRETTVGEHVGRTRSLRSLAGPDSSWSPIRQALLGFAIIS